MAYRVAAIPVILSDLKVTSVVLCLLKFHTSENMASMTWKYVYR